MSRAIVVWVFFHLFGFCGKKYEKTRSRQHTGEIKDSHIKSDKYNFSFSPFMYREVCIFQRKFAYVQPAGTQLLL